MMVYIKNIQDRGRIDACIARCDSAFSCPVSQRNYYEQLLEKICTYAVFLVAESGDSGDVVGYAAAYINDFSAKRAFLTLLAVHPDFQGKGIGEALLQEMEKIAAEREFETFRLEVQTNNRKAIRFYKKHGYVLCDESDHQSCYMEKNLKNRNKEHLPERPDRK